MLASAFRVAAVAARAPVTRLPTRALAVRRFHAPAYRAFAKSARDASKSSKSAAAQSSSNNEPSSSSSSSSSTPSSTASDSTVDPSIIVTPALVTLDASLPDISASAPEETPTQIAARLLKEEDESKGKQKAMWRQWFRMQVGFTVGIVTFFYVAFGLVPGNPLVGLKGYETKVNPDGTVTKKLPDHMTARPGLINLLPHGESNMPDAVRERFLRQQYQEAHHNANQPRLSNRELGLTTDRLGEGTQQGWEASEGARLAMETAKKIIEKENKGIFAAKANTNNAPNVISVGSNAK